jgi:hypothetical protein
LEDYALLGGSYAKELQNTDFNELVRLVKLLYFFALTQN